jgi:dTDP-4-amino-4,6-dideoxygalactose transaminase
MQVPFLDLRTQFQRLREELLPEMTAVMEKAAFIGGPALRDFEAAFAAFCGAEHAVGVASGTDALQLALRAAQVAPGAEVITAANTFVATVEAIALAGCKPVLVDMDPETYHLDIGKIEDAITPRTRVIMPVHLYGDAVDMDPIMEIARRRELLVIEDAAQAYGDGGAVTTGNEEYATRLRQLGDHGSPKKYHHDFLGTNSRLDTLQAVVLATKLRHLPEWNASRRAVARAYEERLGDIEGLRLPRIREGFEPVFHLYVIRSARVKEIDAALQAAGVGFGYHYPVPVHLQPAFRELGEPGRFPEAEKGAQEILSLPMFAEMSEDQIDYVTGTLRAVFER